MAEQTSTQANFLSPLSHSYAMWAHVQYMYPSQIIELQYPNPHWRACGDEINKYTSWSVYNALQLACIKLIWRFILMVKENEK